MSKWIRVTDRPPTGADADPHDNVLMYHPDFGINIRSWKTVSDYVSYKDDTSMHGAYWMKMPDPPAP